MTLSAQRLRTPMCMVTSIVMIVIAVVNITVIIITTTMKRERDMTDERRGGKMITRAHGTVIITK